MGIKAKIVNWFFFKIEKFEKRYTNKKEQNIREALSKGLGSMGPNSFFWGKDHYISGKSNLFIGENVHINTNCYIRAEGIVEIGDNTHISRNVVIYSVNHDFKGNALPYDNQLIKKKVVIGKNVWLGMNVCIAPGTTIGDGAIIGMGTTVSGDVPAHSIVGNEKWRELGKRDLEHYNYLESKQKYGAINGNIYFGTANNVEPNLTKDHPKINTKRGSVELINSNGKTQIRKTFDQVTSGISAFESEKKAIEVFKSYNWFPESHEENGTIVQAYYDQNNRLDLLYTKLNQEQLESVKSQILLAILDIFKNGYVHRDLHMKNIFFVDGQIKIIDFETLLKMTKKVDFFDSYDIIGQHEESPYSTSNMCLFHDNKYSLNQLYKFNTIEDLKTYTTTIMNSRLYSISNTFFTRKSNSDDRHTLTRKLIYNTFDLTHTKVAPEVGQRNIPKRFVQFGITPEFIEGKTVLDLGSNIGGILLGLNKFGYQEALGLEYDIDKVEIAKTLVGLNGIEKVNFHQCDLESPRFQELVTKKYDIVFSLAVIEHLKFKDEFIQNMYNVTGTTLIIEGNANTNMEELKAKLLKIGFAKVDIIGLSNDEIHPQNNNRPIMIAQK